MSKFDGEIRAVGEAVELDDVLVAITRLPRLAANRQVALTQYLSGDDGWRDARDALCGTFAGGLLLGTGLTEGSEQ